MIPVDATQNIVTSGETRSVAKVTTSLKNIPFLINAVTDRIYKDKKLAIVREYSTNAWDEHIKAKIPVDQIQITLPNLENPNFRVRDFGFGLTQDQIRDIYCILGESTKRGSNDFNGQLGLGCKSGFGYGDSFMVTSWVDGEKSVYNIIKGDDQKEGDVILMARCPMTENDRCGIEVTIPIKIDDITEVNEKAANFYKYWQVLPTIYNMNPDCHAEMIKFRDSKPFLKGEGWEVRPKSSVYGSAHSVAVMGQVAYPIDWSMFISKLAMDSNKRIWLDILQSNDIILYFPIGALKFTINREELEYTETTFTNLEKRITDIFASLEQSVIEKFASAKSIWEAKRLYFSLFGDSLEKDENNDLTDEKNDTIKLLEGDFYRLEKMFKGKLIWNNIVINSGEFLEMEKWDLDRPDNMLDDNQEALNPCLITFRRKNGRRIKKMRCTKDKHNTIEPLNSVKVVVLDNKTRSMTQSIARYFLLSENTTVRRVHILRFDSDDQRQRFFNYYNFHTAEYVNTSEITETVRKWIKEYRRKEMEESDHNDGPRTVKMRYIDVNSGTIEEDTDVCLSELDDGGVYVTSEYKECFLKKKSLRSIDLAKKLKMAKAVFNLDLDRVYLITAKKQQSKWFVEANNEQEWVPLDSYLNDNIKPMISEEMARQHHSYVFFSKFHYEINREWLTALVNTLGEDSDFSIFKELVEQKKLDEDPVNQMNDILQTFGLQTLEAPAEEVNYSQKLKAVFKRYPLLPKLPIRRWESVENALLNQIIDYISLINEREFQDELTKSLQVA